LISFFIAVKKEVYLMENVSTMEERRINPVDRRSRGERRNILPSKEVLEIVAGGEFAESAGGIAAVVLTILGLTGIAPVLLTSIATISIGAVMLIKGATVSAEYFKVAQAAASNNVERAELGGGLSGEILAAIAAVVLGILSLLSIIPMILLPIAAIVLGVGLALSSGADVRLNYLRVGQQENRWYQKVLSDMVGASIGAQVLAGLGAAVLGILALVGMAPVILTLVSMLLIGTSVLLSGTSLGGKMLNMVYGTE